MEGTYAVEVIDKESLSTTSVPCGGHDGIGNRKAGPGAELGKNICHAVVIAGCPQI